MTEDNTVVLEEEEKNIGVEIREFKLEGESIKYKMLNITKPEQWQPASDFKLFFNMVSPGSETTSVWELNGISYGDISRLNELYEEPFFEERSECSASEQIALKNHYEKEKSKWENSRRVSILEMATGYSVPGETLEEKIEFITTRDAGELEALNHYIADICTSLSEGREAEMMKQIASLSTASVKKVSNFNDWVKSSGTQAFFRICRPFQDYIVQIPLAGISSKRKLEIDSECMTPIPPKVMGIDPATGRPSPKYLKDNTKDKDYIRAVNAVNDKWIVLMADECLPFKIPGETLEEKKVWISQRLAGDVYKLRQFINAELCGVLSRYNFFTKGSAR